MISNLEMGGRLLSAAILGGAIGFERERLMWAAGLRTHMLVCIGSCLIIIVSAYGFNDVIGKGIVLDPSRVAAQVVSGIGFLGAGTILFRGEAVRGLTTAASLWAVAAIGLAVGSGLYVAGVASTVIVLIVLAGVKPIEERYRSTMRTRNLTLLSKHGKVTFDSIRPVCEPYSRRIQQFILKQNGDEDIDEIEIAFARISDGALHEIADKLRQYPGVTQVEAKAGPI